MAINICLLLDIFEKYKTEHHILFRKLAVDNSNVMQVIDYTSDKRAEKSSENEA